MKNENQSIYKLPLTNRQKIKLYSEILSELYSEMEKDEKDNIFICIELSWQTDAITSLYELIKNYFPELSQYLTEITTQSGETLYKALECDGERAFYLENIINELKTLND